MQDEPIGKEIDGYHIERVLGRGGMGTVYAGEDIALSRKVAIKRVNPSQSHREMFLHRFRSEARALARVDSPYIVSIYALRDTEVGLLIVMEYVDGGTVEDLLEDGAIDTSVSVRILKQTLQACQAAHDAGVIHRDIKPANIMLTRDGRVKVTDFGIAKMRSPDSGQTVTQGGQGGTLKYMAPEQISDINAVDGRSDLYAVGMMAFQMLTGTLPFEQAATDFDIMRRVVEGDVPSPDEYRDDLPPALVGIIERATAQAQDERYPNAKAMIEALAAVEDALESTPAEDAATIVGHLPDPPDDDGSEPGETTVDETALADPPALDETVLDETTMDETALDETVMDEGALDETMLDETVLDETAPEAPPPADPGTSKQPAAPQDDPSSADAPPAAASARAPEPSEATKAAPSDPEAPPERATPSATTRAPVEASEEDRGGRSVLWGSLALLVLLAGLYGGYQFMQGGGGSASAVAVLAVASTPEGATVQVNGDTVGTTPAQQLAVAPGRATVRISKEGYAPFDTTLTLRAGASYAVRGIALSSRSSGPATAQADAPSGAAARPDAPAPGALAANASPPGDGARDAAGNPPSATQASDKTETVRPTDQPSDAPASADQAADPTPTPQAPAPALLQVQAVPTAQVVVNGSEARAPGAYRLTPGPQRVACRHPEYGTIDTTVTVTSGRRAQLTCYFQYPVNVTTTGPWGNVWIDGTNTGKSTPLSTPLQIGPGTHRIELRIARSDAMRVVGGVIRSRVGSEAVTQSFTGASVPIRVRPSFVPKQYAVSFTVQQP
ncbi:serine/threonine-protein kinase [Salisaeta longa]|uniref:serine/threonine-protein kinase n=1 Tax=Salisaeta longa TaxID=503170 RepID=UPI0003B5FF52|nr:serine/threonine-protein kinase [Salisaeta longa]